MNSENRKVLVTGASGVSWHSCSKGVYADWYVYAGMRASSDPWRLNCLIPKDKHYEGIVLDLLSPSSITTALKKSHPEVIVHCAAYGVDYRQQDTKIAIRTNVTGTALMIEEAKSLAVYTG